MGNLLFSASAQDSNVIKIWKVMGILWCITVVGIPTGLVYLNKANNFSRSRLEIYDDHIEGYGVVEGLAASVYLKKEKIETVVARNGSLVVSTEGGGSVYSFVMSVNEAIKAESLINKMKRE